MFESTYIYLTVSAVREIGNSLRMKFGRVYDYFYLDYYSLFIKIYTKINKLIITWMNFIIKLNCCIFSGLYQNTQFSLDGT